MKHNIDDAQLQAAFNEACHEVAKGPHRPMCAELALQNKDTSDWEGESPARLALAKAFLARLPEPSLATDLQRLACEKGNAEAVKEVQQYAATLTTEGGRELIMSLEKCLPEPTPPAVEIMPGKPGHSIVAEAGVAHYVPVVDGKTPGQVAHAGYLLAGNYGSEEKWASAASAVLAAFGGASQNASIQTLSSDMLQDVYFTHASMGNAELPHDHAEALQAVAKAVTEAAIARMEAVPCEQLLDILGEARGDGLFSLNAVRARLIAAARGQGEADAVDWKAKYEALELQAQTIGKMGADAQERAEKADADAVDWKAKADRLENERNGYKQEAGDLRIKLENAEAELADAHSYLDQLGFPRGNGEDEFTLKGRLLTPYPLQPQLSRLRPLSEAGPVPAGAVRVTGYYEKQWFVGTGQSKHDTHFAHILLPQSLPIATLAQDQVQATPEMQAAADAVLREDIEASQPADPYAELKAAHAAGKVIQWHNGQNWIDHILPDNWEPIFFHPVKDLRIKPDPVPTWQPKVGDVVTLKSGGPKMTVMDTEENGKFWCQWFNESGGFSGQDFPAATLQPA